ncbi:MAG: transglycosylase SLT domain-containing protein [Cyclobacteriaceae bacterium]
MREGFLKYELYCLLLLSSFLVKTASGQGSLEAKMIFPNQQEAVEPFYDYDYIPDFTYDEIDQRIKKMETDMPFELNETIFAFIDYFTVRNRDYTKMVLARKDIYFPLFNEVLGEHDMPEDIKFLAIIESGLNPTARSRVGAMGLWQFMPATGKEYQLNYNAYVDDRMDPEMSTEAAIRFLKVLYRRFNDWELALAAYNCGPGNVNKAIRRSGGKKDFWQIYRYLPRETRGYIPQFQAIMYVLRHPEYHNLILEEPTYPIAYEKVNIGTGYRLEDFAKHTAICLEDLEQLNPSLLNQEIPDFKKDMVLKVPTFKLDYISENKEWIKDSLQSNTERLLAAQSTLVPDKKEAAKPLHHLTYRVRGGDVLGKIAHKYGVSVSELKNWNNLYSNTIKVGQVLHVHQEKASFEKNIASNSSAGSGIKQVGNNKTYTVQPGDSLWLISRKLDGVSIEELKKLNNLNNNQIKPGQTLIIG